MVGVTLLTMLMAVCLGVVVYFAINLVRHSEFRRAMTTAGGRAGILGLSVSGVVVVVLFGLLLAVAYGSGIKAVELSQAPRIQIQSDLPIGTVIAYSGELAQAELLAEHGWWICDGRTIDDQRAGHLRGTNTPDLNRRIVVGATSQLHDVGGDSTFVIPALDVTAIVTGWDANRTKNFDPRTGISGGRAWEEVAPLRSTGKTGAASVVWWPPHWNAVYLVKVW